MHINDSDRIKFLGDRIFSVVRFERLNDNKITGGLFFTINEKLFKGDSLVECIDLAIYDELERDYKENNEIEELKK